jgi:hypothetical protein
MFLVSTLAELLPSLLGTGRVPVAYALYGKAKLHHPVPRHGGSASSWLLLWLEQGIIFGDGRRNRIAS